MTKRKLTIGEEVFISGLGYIVWDEANDKALTELCEEIENIARQRRDNDTVSDT